MGIVTDETAIQFRMLNRSKGPAMWSPRSQSDRTKFIATWRSILENTENLYMWQDSVNQVLVKDGRVTGVVTDMNVTFTAKCVVLTTGTFMNGLMHIVVPDCKGGVSLSRIARYYRAARGAGFYCRTYENGNTGSNRWPKYSFRGGDRAEGRGRFSQVFFLDFQPRPLKQRSCWTIYTNEQVHDILRAGLPDSPLYNGQIQSIGPRYCPSIETKIVTFPDKTEHQLFLEPEGETTQEYYLNGFSSSLPLDIQVKALQEIPALRDVRIYRPGYAIEYDYFDPTQLNHNLETKQISNLFFAGQINGTTGYEEAGGQGLIAGINAHINCHGGAPFTLGRDEAYIGVFDRRFGDKGVDEP